MGGSGTVHLMVDGRGLPVTRVVACVRERFREALTLEEMARAAGLSRTQLVRVFKRAMKVSPHRYLTRYRVAQAVKVMRSFPDRPLEEVAREVGIHGARNFCRVMRRILGCRPSAIRHRSSRGRLASIEVL